LNWQQIVNGTSQLPRCKSNTARSRALIARICIGEQRPACSRGTARATAFSGRGVVAAPPRVRDNIAATQIATPTPLGRPQCLRTHYNNLVEPQATTMCIRTATLNATNAFAHPQNNQPAHKELRCQPVVANRPPSNATRHGSSIRNAAQGQCANNSRNSPTLRTARALRIELPLTRGIAGRRWQTMVGTGAACARFGYFADARRHVALSVAVRIAPLLFA